MNGLINVIQVIINSSNAPVQLIKTYLNDVRKTIFWLLWKKTNTDVKMFLTIKAEHVHSKSYNHQPWLLVNIPENNHEQKPKFG